MSAAVVLVLVVLVPLCLIGAGVVIGAIGNDMIRGARVVLDEPARVDVPDYPRPGGIVSVRPFGRVDS